MSPQKRDGNDVAAGDGSPKGVASAAAAPTPRRQLQWVVFAAVPSSLLLGVTNFLTTDLAAIPLLWVGPLALYLLTWIATFARRPWWSLATSARVLPILVVAWLLLYLTEATQPAAVLVGFHLLTFGAAAMVCHGRLAADRPPPVHLTRFFLLTSLGGVLGGSFNALLAPLILPDLWEYPIAIVAACLALPSATVSTDAGKGRDIKKLHDIGWAAAVALGAVALIGLTSALGLPAGPLRTGVSLGLPVLAAWLLVDRPLRFALAVAALLCIAPMSPSPSGAVVRKERSFFGVQRVTADPSGRFVQVVHGHTLHGRQWREGRRRCEPLAYYHRQGPLGDIWAEKGSSATAIGMIGVGAGSMFDYRRPGTRWWAVDIDPATWSLARDQFTFLRDCPTDLAADDRAATELVAADGRRAIETLPDDRRFDLLVVDVFSSDAIPVHMLTREAFRSYLRHLAPRGWLVFHASNRYLDIVSVLAAVADAEGLATIARDDRADHRAPGAEPSRWVVVARESGLLAPLRDRNDWRRPGPAERAGDDDFNDLPRLFAASLLASAGRSDDDTGD